MDLKQRVDLREVVRQHWGDPVRRNGRYDVHRSMWREDGRRASFTVYKESYKDYGGDGATGDVLTFMQRERGFSFVEALHWLADYCGIGTTKTAPTRPVIGPNSYAAQRLAAAAPPAKVWQKVARAAVRQAEVYLWSGAADAQLALAYLRDVRGLNDQTIKAARYGYNPAWRRLQYTHPETGKRVSLAPGIIEPWVFAGNLWAVRVRCRVGNLAAALGLPDDTLRGERSPKYLNLAGSKQSGAFYNGDAVAAGSTVLLVEGGFDAMVAQQACAGTDVVAATFGSATNLPNDLLLARLRTAARVILLLDDDEAGQSAQAKLLAALGDQAVALRLPTGKDVTEFVVERGGDLPSLLADATRPAWWHDGVPDSVRSALMKYCRISSAAIVELIHRATARGLLHPDCFTINEVLHANEELAFNLGPKTIRRVFNEMTGYLWTKMETSNRPKSVSNSVQKGRRAVTYALVDRATFIASLLAWATPRIYERKHRTTGDDALVAQPTPAMLQAIGMSADEAEALAPALDQAFKRAYALQEHKQLAASERALRELARLTESLERTHSTPLPTQWPLNDAAHYRAAFLRATNDPSERRSRREMCQLLGAANGSLSHLLKLAGLEKQHSEGEYEILPLRRPFDLENEARRLSGTAKGYPKWLLSYDETGAVVHKTRYNGADSQAYVLHEVAAGRDVCLQLQVANHYHATSEEPPQIERARKAGGGGSSSSKRPRFYGPGYDPQWVHEQLCLALQRMGRLAWAGSATQPQALLDVLTGEIHTEGLSNYAMLELLLPHHTVPARLHPLVIDAVQLGGELVGDPGEVAASD